MQMGKKLALLILIAMASLHSARADQFSDRMGFWEKSAFSCTEAGAPFPSKYRTPTPDDPTECEDGDMTLFNGLLCAAGDERGCSGVARAQSGGRWWRSPRRIGIAYPKTDVSFSPDMLLGVLHYVTNKQDANAFRAWLTWVESARPCLAEAFGKCLIKGWPRVCTDDSEDKRCTFRPTTCSDLELVGARLNVAEARLCRRVLDEFKIRSDYIIPDKELAVASALVNEAGYPMHLAGVHLFLFERLGGTSVATRAGAVALALRQPRNPFFVYLAEGPTQRVKDLVLELCPTPQKPSVTRMQWAWERDAAEKAYENSMYWDCIFMGKLLGY